MKNEKNILDENITGIISENIQQVLLDSLPCVAFVIKSMTMEVVASNHAARVVGACSGTKEGVPTLWRFEPANWINSGDNHLEIEADGVLWDAHWISLHNDHYLLYAFDITQHKKTEKVFKNTQQTLDCYRKIFQQMPQAAFIVAADGIIIDINDAAATLLDYLKPELIGQHIARIYDLEQIIDLGFSADILKSGSPILNEDVVVRTKNNKRRTLQLTVSPEGSDDSLAIHTLSFQNELNDGKQFDKEHLRNVKIEALNHIAGGVAHEFNNLLGGIYGYIDLAVAKSEDKKVARYLAKALDTIERAKSLTTRLMTCAKDGIPRTKSEKIFPFINESVLKLLEGGTVAFRCEVADNLWLTKCDKDQIGKVIHNIVTNAVEAMPSGGSLTIKASNTTFEKHEHKSLEAGHYIAIAIKDDGEGIPTLMLPHIFDPFYTTRPQGKGLGLTVSYSIIHRHDGCIDVYSYPGQGSIFTIYLPAVVNEDASTEIASCLNRCYNKKDKDKVSSRWNFGF